MNTVHIRISFGLSNSLERDYPRGTTIGQVVNDPNVRQALGAPANVRALVHRVEQSLNSPISDGDEIILETVGTSKAA